MLLMNSLTTFTVANEGTKVYNPRRYILLCIVIFSIMLYV